MKIVKPQTVAFTSVFNGIVGVLVTPVKIISVDDESKQKDLKGIWDTGATHSSIHKKYAEELSLPVVGMCQVNTAGGTVNATQHLVHMILPNQQKLSIMVTATDLVNTDMLIGMDIISQGDFAVSNYNGQTKLNFRMPSFADTDFVASLKNMIPVKSNAKIGRNDKCPCGSGKKYKSCCGKYSR